MQERSFTLGGSDDKAPPMLCIISTTLQAVVEKQERSLTWGGFDDKAPPEKVTVVIYHMFGTGELSEDRGAADELEKEVLVEAGKLGPVEKVRGARVSRRGLGGSCVLEKEGLVAFKPFHFRHLARRLLFCITGSASKMQQLCFNMRYVGM